jgi:hypothetical protein
MGVGNAKAWTAGVGYDGQCVRGVGERQETVADKETIALLQLFASNPDIEKAVGS